MKSRTHHSLLGNELHGPDGEIVTLDNLMQSVAEENPDYDSLVYAEKTLLYEVENDDRRDEWQELCKQFLAEVQQKYVYTTE